MSEFQPTDPSFEVLANIRKAVNATPIEKKGRILEGVFNSIAEHKVDCLAKHILLRCLMESTPDSFLQFVAAQGVCHDPAYKETGLDGMSVKVLRLMQDEHKNPVFWRICSEVKKEIAQAGEMPDMPEDYRRQIEMVLQGHIGEMINRRDALRKMVIGATAVMAGDALLTPWTKEDEKGNVSPRYVKLGRLAAEYGVRHIAKIGMLTAHAEVAAAAMIDDVAPFIEKEVGVPAAPQVFERGSSRGVQGR